MLGIASDERRSSVGRIDDSMTAKSSAGARVCDDVRFSVISLGWGWIVLKPQIESSSGRGSWDVRPF